MIYLVIYYDYWGCMEVVKAFFDSMDAWDYADLHGLDDVLAVPLG